MKLGFEAEFHTGVEALASALHTAGLSGSDHMHSYHCGCDDCTTWDWPFRVQSDSSCGGEVISSPFTDWRALRRAIDKLSTLAVDLDVEPGMDSGFHVHSSVERLDYYQRVKCWTQFIRWEPALQLLAEGRFTNMRGFNHSARESFRRVFPDGDYNAPASDPYRWHDQFLDYGDRHCAINIRTRNHATIEFRLWNSTRAAWRMHMFAGLSHMFTHLPFIEKVSEECVTDDPETDAKTLRRAYAECAPRSTVPGYIDKQLDCERTNEPFHGSFVTQTAPAPRNPDIRWEPIIGSPPLHTPYAPDGVVLVDTPRFTIREYWLDHNSIGFGRCTYDTPCPGCRFSHADYADEGMEVISSAISNW